MEHAVTFLDTKRQLLPSPAVSCGCEPPPHPYENSSSQPIHFQPFGNHRIFASALCRRYNPFAFKALCKPYSASPVFSCVCAIKRGRGLSSEAWPLRSGGGAIPGFRSTRMTSPRKRGIGDRMLPPLFSGGRTSGTRSTMQRAQTPCIESTAPAAVQGACPP